MLKNVGEIIACRSWSNSARKIILDRTFATTSVINSNSANYDIVVVGGGIVGVASAREIINRFPNLQMSLLEKENRLAHHQTGNNSGVIHAGIYYKPGSLKAKLCVEGMHLSYNYFDLKQIPYKKCGKLIVATNKNEVELLKEIHQRGIKNNVPGLKLLNSEKEIKEIEPLCKGIQALWSPETGIVDWALATRHLAEDFKNCNGKIFLNFEVNRFIESGDPNYPIQIRSTTNTSIKTKYVLTCGGLYSDHIAIMSGCSGNPKIIPFRGEYLVLTPEKSAQIRTNIYPVPDPRFPFLGVHVTPRMDGSVWLGPNAVLAFKREGYRWGDISPGELFETLSYPGFMKLAYKLLVPGTKEVLKSFITNLQLKDIQKFVPSITKKDIKNVTGPSGVRAQALDIKGNLVDDFIFDRNAEGGPVSSRILHCRNAPSPAATSSLSIAKAVADRCQKEFNLI